MNKKILIVTSNKDHRFLLSSLFKNCGYKIDAPEEITSSVDMIKAFDYYKIVVDYDEHNLYNRILCKNIEKLNCFSKSIIINTEIDGLMANKIFSLGGVMIDKPYDTHVLLDAVK